MGLTWSMWPGTVSCLPPLSILRRAPRLRAAAFQRPWERKPSSFMMYAKIHFKGSKSMYQTIDQIHATMTYALQH